MKKFQKARYLVIGLMIGIFFSLPTSQVLASTGSRAIEVIFNNIAIYLDGNKLDPKDANGNPVEPFIYNGTTYLPVRAIGEAIGRNVEWDAPNFSVYLGKRPDGTGATMWLTNLTPVVSQQTWWNRNSGHSVGGNSERQIRELNESDSDNFGNRYDSGFVFRMDGNGYYEYNSIFSYYATDVKYTSLSGTIALSSGTRDTASHVVFRVYEVNDLGSEGRELYRSTVLTAGARPIVFNVNITGQMTIGIELSASDSSGEIRDSNGNRHSLGRNGEVNIILGNIGLN